jgi:cysteine-S-conjugate beta-lyase
MQDLSRCVHHPAVSHEGFASLTVPTYRASTIVFKDAEEYAKRKYRGPDGYTYGLHGTPTTRTLEEQLSALEQGERTVLVPSGQAGVTIVMLTVLLPNDRVLIPDTVYPPVRGFCQNYLLPRGIDYEVYDPSIGAGIAALIDKRTKLVWCESPGSTTMEFQDIPAIAKVAHEKGALVGCDNTWATPLLFKPLAHGADFAMEAITKYVGGHSDLLMGSISVKDIALHRRLKDTTRMIGIGVSPDDCSMALRGLETMGIRIKHMGEVAEAFARRITELPVVDRVLHPALPACPGHELWKRDFAGASGVFSVVLKPGAEKKLDDALSSMKVFQIGASWGGTHSLIVPMAIKSDRTVKPWTEDGTILRISVGLEDPKDLWDDLTGFFGTLAQGFEKG